jgi:acetyl-CoA synthetase
MSSITWSPSKELVEESNLFALMRDTKATSFESLHALSIQRPNEFWAKTIRRLGIRFSVPYDVVCDDSAGAKRPRWLAGARLNIAESCFKKDSRLPAILTGHSDGSVERMTIDELDRLSNRVANSLKQIGLKKGDAVAVYLAMTAETVAIYLGIIKMGGVVVSISESFVWEEVAKRLHLGKALAVFTQETMRRAGKNLPLYKKVYDADGPRAIVLPGDNPSGLHLRPGDLTWEAFLTEDDRFVTVTCSPQDPINVLFSSGTTGDPKAIPWDHTTPIKAASDAHYHHDLKAGEVVCWPTSLGWMMGPWLVFATLLNDGIIALYDGSPLERGFCLFVQKAKVTMLGVVPSIVKVWRNSGCAENLDWRGLRAFSSSGEASNANDYAWLMQLNQTPGTVKPVIEYCGGTELGGGYLTSTLLNPQRPAEFNGKTLGIDFVVLDEDGRLCRAGETGEAFLIAPSMGMSTQLINGDNDEVYYASCPTWEGMTLRRHGDRIRVLGDNRFQSDGRSDNTMNLGGIKVGSAEIERCLNHLAGVIDLAAVGIPPVSGGPDRLVLYVVFAEADAHEGAQAVFQQQIKEHLNPLFRVHDVVAVDVLPRTASNKVLHRELRKRYQCNEAKSLLEP